jgi:predicted AAA+ superfamily ATPase
MENIIAIELFRNISSNPALKIFYWKDYYGKEINFVVMENLTVKELIGVSFISNEIDIEEREIDSMVKGSKIFKTDNIKLITWKFEGEKNINGKKIKFIPLRKFFLYGKDMQLIQ